MNEFLSGSLSLSKQDLLNRFKEYAISHPHLVQVDKAIMQAIKEPAGFAHVLVYGPSGVGKTTMIRQIARRLNENLPEYKGSVSNLASRSNGTSAPMPLLLLETRPPDGGVFNRADYYRTALKLLGEPFYERRMLVDIDAESTWEKKGRTRSKTAQFNDSPELRYALEEAIGKRGVRSVILDEAQHLMKIGNGSSAGKLLDQLDWIKSMTNVTGVLHILIGTYELLNFRNLSGQSSRRGLDIHFPRYLFQAEKDRIDFQGVLLALLKYVPLNVEIPALMQHWVYFYERSVGCVGVLKDWLVRAVAAALHDDCDQLTLERLEEHALTLAQCESIAVDAIEGEQKLNYTQSRREHLWRLLQKGMDDLSIPAVSTTPEVDTPSQATTDVALKPAKTKRTKRSSPKQTHTVTQTFEANQEAAPKKRRQSKKIKEAKSKTSKTQVEVDNPALDTEPSLEESKSSKKRSGRVGVRTPKRDPVG